MLNGGVKFLHLSELFDALACAVPTAKIVATSPLTRSAFVAVKAVALPGLVVAYSLVGALHIKVTFICISIRVLLASTPWIYFGSCDNSCERPRDPAVAVKISLGSVNVGNVERAAAKRAVVSFITCVAKA
jgi:hypothetical protein